MITKMKTKLGNVLTLLSIFFISLLVTGCGTTKEYVTKYETVYVVLEPPKELYNPKKRIKPPNRKEYLEASFEEKEAMLFDHINKLNEEINFFLTDRSSIDKWIAKEKELIKSKRELK